MAERDATVLVVDDEPSLVDLYALRLDDDYEVRKAYDGEEALTKMDEAVDVVLLDRRMPDVQGDVVLESIREADYDCRVAVVTAVDPGMDVLEMGFDAYLVKPVRAPELNATVERLLDQDQYDEELKHLLSMATRISTIEERKDREELQKSTVYRRLEAEFEELRDRLAEDGHDVDRILSTLGPQ